jgi:hypothetical protein
MWTTSGNHRRVEIAILYNGSRLGAPQNCIAQQWQATLVSASTSEEFLSSSGFTTMRLENGRAAHSKRGKRSQRLQADYRKWAPQQGRKDTAEVLAFLWKRERTFRSKLTP